MNIARGDWALVLCVLFAYMGILALAMSGSRFRRMALIVLATTMLAVPFVVGFESPWLRTLVVIGLIGSFLRLVDLAHEAESVSPLRRIVLVTTMVDIGQARRVAPGFDTPAFFRFLAFGAVCLATGLAVVRLPPVTITAQIVWWIAWVVVSYTLVDALVAFVDFVWRAIGFVLPSLHDHPIMSRTVAEFWGRRWNRTVSQWLRIHCHMPLVRRRLPRCGLLAAFTVSMLMHVYLAWAVFDLTAALMWGIFFLVQIPIVFVERGLRVTTWPVPLARAWTIGMLLLVSPCFVYPVIHIAEAFR